MLCLRRFVQFMVPLHFFNILNTNATDDTQSRWKNDQDNAHKNFPNQIITV